jgi:hypothetical protein
MRRFVLNYFKRIVKVETQKQSKLFAFKLAEKQVKEVTPAAPWKVREGVSVAGCSGPVIYDNWRDTGTRPPYLDTGIFC